MSVLLQGFFFGVESASATDWWDHLAGQAQDLRKVGFSAIWLPPPYKGASGGVSNGYDPFDDYDLGSKDQRVTVPTHYGTREQLQRCAAMMRANGIDVYVDLVENQRDGDDGHFNFVGEHFKPGARKGRGVVHLIGWAASWNTILSPKLTMSTFGFAGFTRCSGAAFSYDPIAP